MRNRKLSFTTVLLTMLSKGAKSLQVTLNELVDKLEQPPITASAYSQARKNLSHTAFIELNEVAVRAVYEDENVIKLNGYRVFAIDGSKLRLPNNPATRAEFGEVAYSDGKGSTIKGSHCGALLSVLYDVFNRIPVDSLLAHVDAYEGDLAAQHINNAGLSSQDIVILDQGYPSFKLIAQCHKAGVHFVMRCSTGSFSQAQRLHEGEGNESTLTKLKANKGRLALINNGLATEIDVRFVSVTLDTGETEVLVTSLVDEEVFQPEDFKGLYWFRWEIETFYGLLKTRLGLENFTGYHPEAIRQDIYSTLYLATLEAILTQQAQQILDDKPTKHPQEVNRMVSFNVIKSNILELLFAKETPPDLLERLTRLFLMNPTCWRKRSYPRRKKKDWQKSAEFHKWKRKFCF